MKLNLQKTDVVLFLITALCITSNTRAQIIYPILRGSSHGGIYISQTGNRISQKQQLQQQATERTSVDLLDSTYEWYPNGNSWDYWYKTIDFAYDANNNCLSDSIKDWAGVDWGKHGLDNYTYNTDNFQLTSEFLWWNGYTYLDSALYTNTYDGNNNCTSQLYQSGNFNGSSWVNNTLYSVGYDTNNNADSAVFQLWGTSSWVNFNKDAYTYDTKHNELSDTNYNWEGSFWMYNELVTYSYNADNKVVSFVGQGWDGAAWDSNGLTKYTYDSHNNISTILDQYWNSGWANGELTTFTYDDSNNLLTQYDQIWSNSTWANNYIYTYTWNINNEQTSHLYRDWSNGDWINEDSMHFYYNQSTTGVNQLSINSDQLLLYPNPASDYFNVSLSQQQSQPVQLTLYNILGQRVWYNNLGTIKQTQATVPVTNLAEGVYVLKVNSGGTWQQREIVVAR